MWFLHTDRLATKLFQNNLQIFWFRFWLQDQDVYSLSDYFFQKNSKLIALLLVCNKGLYSDKPNCVVLTKIVKCFRNPFWSWVSTMNNGNRTKMAKKWGPDLTQYASKTCSTTFSRGHSTAHQNWNHSSLPGVKPTYDHMQFVNSATELCWLETIFVREIY